ncbi:hypothetical protein AUC71_11095 [Methyloceanibacter marginalis]|uniref:Uncharacterized protein n=1 Tax=Methyloceanibacter marginalis TaxID=1774971 RepID=A0A1E3WBJ8_9HYPH|nr:hypothetical protein [Methyloceanibacter marginalis]ODS03184.1 hypothetical protein AUC71_11095 [Methyloceanibacter marginalis]
MSLSPPTTVVFVVSIILAVLAIIGAFVPIPFITEHGFWVASWLRDPGVRQYFQRVLTGGGRGTVSAVP